MIKQRDSLHEEGFRGENLGTEQHSSGEPTRSVALGWARSRWYLTIGGIPISVIVEGIACWGS